MGLPSRHRLLKAAVALLGVTGASAGVLQRRGECSFWRPAYDGYTCLQLADEWGITEAAFISYNPGVPCPDLVPNEWYCVEWMGTLPPPAGASTTTTGGTPSTVPPAVPTTTSSRPATTTTSSSTTTTTAPPNGIQTPQPHQPGMVTNCNKFHLIKSTTTCEGLYSYNKITRENLLAWNPAVGPHCEIWLDSYVCVGVIGWNPPPPSTTTLPPDGVATPTPIQSGMVTNCNKFHHVRPTTTCENLLSYNKITMADFYKWNPDVGPDCRNMQSGTYACTGVSGGTQPQPPANGIETPTPIQPGMVTNCNKFATVRPTTTCQGILDWNKITLANFVKWNPAVGADCTKLQANTFACIGVIGGTTPPTPPSNGIETPTPIQPGMVTNCNKFATVRPTTTCQGILDWNKITLANFVKWNPAVGADCTKMQANTFACIGVIGGTTPPSNGIETPTPIQPNMVTNCNKFHHIRPTTTCPNLLSYNKITMAELFKWNPDVKSDCSNLQANTYACTGVIGGSPTTPGNGIETPLPIQAGMVTNCNKFHHIRSTTTCPNLLSYNKITMADLFKWNPAVKSDCSNLWTDTYACVGVIGGSPSQPGNGVTTPSPTQPGMVNGCTAFATVRPTTTCQGILDWNKITMANFFKWNPGVGRDCTNLWTGTWACIAGP